MRSLSRKDRIKELRKINSAYVKHSISFKDWVQKRSKVLRGLKVVGIM